MQPFWNQLVQSRWAVWLTHGSLIALSATLWLLLWFAPWWIVLLPGVLLAHRIGILLHEYLHGIPFRSYRDNLAVYGFFDSTMLMFGLMELFRGTHLAHHRWLNTAGDNAVRGAQIRPRTGWLQLLVSNEVSHHVLFLWQAFRGQQPLVRLSRVAGAAAISTACVVGWCLMARADIVVKLLSINLLTVLIPASLRGAIEHHGPPGATGFANEYRVWIPLFNLNRHVHHHEDMHCPWYLLKFRTPEPLAAQHYFTHWFHVYLRGDYKLLRPMSETDLPSRSEPAFPVSSTHESV